MTNRVAAPIDPLAPTVAGRYEDELVVVQASPGLRPAGSVRTEHFDVASIDGRLVVSHSVPARALDDDLAGLLVAELFVPGWVRGSELFERIFTGVVRSSRAGALESWELFYRNTMRRLESQNPPGDRGERGSIADYAPVHEHALALLHSGSVMELGCCFGFLSLRVARGGRAVTASDVTAGTIRLLHAVAPRLGAPVSTLVADAARVPAADSCADNVLAVHLLEHLEPEHGRRVLREAVRLARRRVLVAVPLEQEANETYGHVRTISLDDLHAWGRDSALTFEVHEHHGGWLVIDVA